MMLIWSQIPTQPRVDFGSDDRMLLVVLVARQHRPSTTATRYVTTGALLGLATSNT